MPATVDLSEMLSAEDIHFGFRAASVVEAIPMLLRPALLRRLHDPALVDPIIAAAVKREQETPTRCGSLVLPHTRHAGVRDFVLAVGTNASGVIAGEDDPRLVFAFVSPEERREQHLQLLASLARLSQNAWIVEKIVSAHTASEVLETLHSAGV